MADVPVLVCVDGTLTGQHIVVTEGGLNLGRSEDNHVQIDDDGVSRFHARLLLDNGSLWLQDAGSRNGVFVNGARITQHVALKVGDQVTIAKHTFVVRLETDSQVPAATRARPAHASGGDATTESEDPPEATPRSRWFWPFS